MSGGANDPVEVHSSPIYIPSSPTVVSSSPVPEPAASSLAPSEETPDDGEWLEEFVGNNLEKYQSPVDTDEDFLKSFTEGSVNTARKRALDVDYVQYLTPKELRELKEELKQDYYLVRGGSYDTDCYLSNDQWKLFCSVESNHDDEDPEKLKNPFTRQPVKPEKFSANGEPLSVGKIPKAERPVVGQFGLRPADNLRPRVRMRQPICVCVTDVCC